MEIIHFFASLLTFSILPACVKQETKSELTTQSGIDIRQYMWENRIILSYPLDTAAGATQRELVKKFEGEMKDRDLIIIRLEGREHSNHIFTKADRLALIKKYRLVPGSHILIGKDGGIKVRQSGKLDLLPLLTLIDQMPMRRSEMKSSED